MVTYPRLRKCLVVGIILLFVLTCLIPSTAQDNEKPSLSSSKGNILYVGGSGLGNYTRIQDAIDNASGDDTVYVYSGMYSDYIAENLACVRINKSISLIGQDKATTIINGSGYHDTIRIEGTKITLSGFTVRTDGLSWYIRVGITIDYPSQDIDIHDTIITQNYYGILFVSYTYGFSLNNINIYENSIVENIYGIENENVYDYSNIQIHHNMISQNENGIHAGHNYTVYDNIIVNNSIGILIATGEENIIHRNDIRDNNVGLSIYNFLGSEISENNFINNNKHTSVERDGLLSSAPFMVLLRQKWSNNYFDDWLKKTPKPILGRWSISIYFWIPPGPPSPLRIAVLPYFEFDRSPALKPYDIPGMR